MQRASGREEAKAGVVVPVEVGELGTQQVAGKDPAGAEKPAEQRAQARPAAVAETATLEAAVGQLRWRLQ